MLFAVVFRLFGCGGFAAGVYRIIQYIDYALYKKKHYIDWAWVRDAVRVPSTLVRLRRLRGWRLQNNTVYRLCIVPKNKDNTLYRLNMSPGYCPRAFAACSAVAASRLPAAGEYSITSVQEVVTHIITVSYDIKLVTTSWTYCIDYVLGQKQRYTII